MLLMTAEVQSGFRNMQFREGSTHCSLDTLLLSLLCVCVPTRSCRLLAEEDVAAGPGPISAAAGDDGAELYTAGGVEAAGFDAAKFNLYLVRKVRAGSTCQQANVTQAKYGRCMLSAAFMRQ